MSRAAREWVRGLGEHLTGSPRALLWATADRANNAGEFWTSERTMARESGVSYPHVRRLVPGMVTLGVWDKLKPAAGPRPAVYRFTLIDPAGLPTALMVSAVGDGLVRSSETLVRSSEASSALMVSAKPEEPGNHPAKGGCLVHPESNDRDRDGLAADTAAAPAQASDEPDPAYMRFKAEWRQLLAPPPSQSDSVEEAAKKRAARERWHATNGRRPTSSARNAERRREPQTLRAATGDIIRNADTIVGINERRYGGSAGPGESSQTARMEDRPDHGRTPAVLAARWGHPAGGLLWDP